MKEIDFMNAALEEARIALSEGEIPVGCVAVRGGEIVARAHNEREKTGDPTAHAEILALRRVPGNDWRREDITLYVTLEPCPMCAGAISQARVKEVVFAAHDPDRGCAGSVYRIPEDPAFSWFCRCRGGFMEEHGKALMDEFFARRRSR